MHAPTLISGTQRRTHYQRFLMLFVLVFLALQLIGAGSHNHAYTDHAQDCAACMVADMPAGAPPPPAVVAPVPLLAGLPLPLQQSTGRIAVAGNYLTPPSHAPPGAAVLSF